MVVWTGQEAIETLLPETRDCCGADVLSKRLTVCTPRFLIRNRCSDSDSTGCDTNQGDAGQGAQVGA